VFSFSTFCSYLYDTIEEQGVTIIDQREVTFIPHREREELTACLTTTTTRMRGEEEERRRDDVMMI